MTKQSMTPPTNDEVMENKLVALAYRQAQKKLEEGTASSQLITHLLRMGSNKGQVEIEKLRLENQLLKEKIRSEQSGQQLKEMFEEVMVALKSYSYQPPGEDDVDIF